MRLSSTCSEGRWHCKILQTPMTCAVEEGSHVTTFDGKTYTFHGDCYYTLAKVQSKVPQPQSTSCELWARTKKVWHHFFHSLFLSRTLQVQSSVFWLSWCRADIKSSTLALRALKWCWTVTEITWVWKKAISWLYFGESTKNTESHQSLPVYSGVNVHLRRLSEAEHTDHQFALSNQWAETIQ